MNQEQAFAQQVINELGLTERDVNKLLDTKSSYRNYCKQMIRDIRKDQLKQLENVVVFSENSNITLKKKQSLINFLEHEPYYKSSNFFILFCKFAHQATINSNTKIRIIEYNTDPNELSIANRFQNPQTHINPPPQAHINLPLSSNFFSVLVLVPV